MTINYNELSQSEYITRRDNLIGAKEGLVLSVYCDHTGIPTIGYGVNLSVYADKVYERLEITNKILTDELDVLFSKKNYNTTTIQPILNEILERYGYAPDSFKLTEQAMAEGIYNEIIGEKEDRFDNRFSVDVPDSVERTVLLSLFYNRESLIGTGIINAINAGNRSEAWYEIRYASNSSRDSLMQPRRFTESDLFGLFKGDPTDISSREVYLMYQNHATQIRDYETHPNLSSRFNSNNNIQSQLTPATTYFNSTYASQHGRTYDWDQIVVKGDSTTSMSIPQSALDKGVLFVGSQDYSNTLQGTDHNDILQGGNEEDTLVGGLGEDILVGNDGNDVLDKTAA